MRYNGLITNKLARLSEEQVNLSRFISGYSIEKFSSDWAARSAVERSLQVMIEIMIDIAERVVSLENAGPIVSSVKSMEKLQELGVVKSAEKYCQMVRFRNFIVHIYDMTDPAIVYKVATGHLNDFLDFKDEIMNA